APPVAVLREERSQLAPVDLRAGERRDPCDAPAAAHGKRERVVDWRQPLPRELAGRDAGLRRTERSVEAERGCRRAAVNDAAAADAFLPPAGEGEPSRAAHEIERRAE